MILLSFDIEEFDMPLEYQGKINTEEQLQISAAGLKKILVLLKKYNIRATFFSTVIFAENNRDLILQLLEEGHELASHTWFHSRFEMKHLRESREYLAELFDTEIKGMRMPRMADVPATEVAAAGYCYNSSINPTFIPGRYNRLSTSRVIFEEEGLWQIPASVSPWRIPLFWLSFHNFPPGMYRYLSKRALKKDGYLNLYFHPWEFENITRPSYRLPWFVTRNTGQEMVRRFDDYLSRWTSENFQFGTFTEFLEERSSQIKEK